MESFFRHPHALVESTRIGGGTRIWAFAHILPGAVIGRDCNICDHVFIENDVSVGDRVTVKCGVQLWDGVRIEDDVFIGPNATFTNNPLPRSRERLDTLAETYVRKGASIGANATIVAGISVGQFAMIGAGAVVTRSVPPYAVVVGNPARIRRFLRTPAKPPRAERAPSRPRDGAVEVRGVEMIAIPLLRDPRGTLIAPEKGHGLPFVPERCAVVYDVPSGEARGEYACRRCAQLLVCVRGSVVVRCDDGRRRQEFLLDDPTVGLHLRPMVWGTQHRYTRDAMLLVLASHASDPHDDIRDYDQFLAEVAGLDPAAGAGGASG